MIYPVPKKAEITGEYPLDTLPGVCFCADPELDDTKFGIVFGEVPAGNAVKIKAKYAVPEINTGSEAFTLDIKEAAAGVTVIIRCLTNAALVRALFRIKKMMTEKKLPLGTISDHPSFMRRGFIEGFYGKPWSHAQRLEMMYFMASAGENCVYYAPKDDPYHRRLWRELYPAKELKRLKELSGLAQSLCMSFAYCIAPGLNIRYTDPNDITALQNKLKQLFDVGIRDFGVLLDDIPEGFSCPEDRAAYPDFSHAHTDLVNMCHAFIKSLAKDCTLTVCPTVYWGKGDDEYDIYLGGHIPQDVLLFFTGRDICSREITCDEAVMFKKYTSHAPLYWDNFPVNDAEMFKEMHLSPLNGREPQLYRCCEGLISNGMEYYECNKFPLLTAADYLWAPESYDPERSFFNAVNSLLPSGEAEDIFVLADHLRTSCLRDENSRVMGEYLSKATAFIAGGEKEKAVPFVKNYTEKANKAKINFTKYSGALYKELSEWISKFSLMTELLSDSLLLLTGAVDDEKSAKAALRRKMTRYNNCATVLTAFCFREYIEILLET